MGRPEETLYYSSINEDAASEVAALRPVGNERAVVVTGSGARVLDLMPEWDGPIVAVDINGAQAALLQLKLAAARHLVYEAYLSFLGLDEGLGPSTDQGENRRETYRSHIAEHLADDARRFWNRHSRTIAGGVLHAGKWERFFGGMSRALQFVNRGAIDRLFAAATLEKQAGIWSEEWTRGVIGALLRGTSRPWFWSAFYGDPAFSAHTPAGSETAGYVMESLSAASKRFLFRESAFATQLFRGRLTADGPLPPHLSEGYPRPDSGRVTVVTFGLVEWLETQPSASVDLYSLSDVGSYLDAAGHAELWREIVRTARPGARVCERQFLVKRDLPSAALESVHRDRDLEQRIAMMDTSIFYTFIVGGLP